MFYLTKKNLQSLLLGSLFFGTGGGLPYKQHKEIIQNALKKKGRIKILGASEFKKNDYLATIYGVGDPSRTRVNFVKLARKAVNEYKKITKINIRGIIPGELGAEGLAFQAAAELNLPVVDSDLVGGRAAPKIQMDVFSVFNLPLTPLLGFSDVGSSILFSGKYDAKNIEETLRNFFQENKGSGVLVGYPIKASKYKKFGMQSTLSQSIRIGGYLSQGKLNRALTEVKGSILTRSKITRANLKSERGFLEGSIKLKHFKISVKNENIAMYDGKKSIVSSPDLIIIFGIDKKPIHNTDIKKYIGKEVIVVHVPAFGYWKSKRAKKLWI